jgi:hypothetical protein
VAPLDQRSRITPIPSHAATTAFTRVVEQQHRSRIFLGRFEVRSAKRFDDREVYRLDLFLGFVPVKLDALEVYPSQNANNLFIFRILKNANPLDLPAYPLRNGCSHLEIQHAR